MRGEWKATGDPTEVALQVFAHKLGLGRSGLTSDAMHSEAPTRPHALGKVISSDPEKPEIPETKQADKRYELKAEFPFSSELKRMSTVYFDKTRPDEAIILIKGAVCVPSLRHFSTR